MSDEFEDDNGASPEGVEMVVVGDEGGRGVFVSCAAQLPPVDLVAGLCELLAQVTRAVVARPNAARAGDLELGGDELLVN